MSAKASGATATAGGAGGMVTAFLEFIGVIGANAAGLGLLLSFTGISIGGVFYFLNWREARKQTIEAARHNREMERIEREKL